MLNIKKAPTLVALIKGTSVGATHEVWGKRIMAAVGMEPVSAGFSLTVGRLSATLKTPKYNERRTASAIPVSPQRAGKAPEKALLKVLHIMPCRRFIRQVRAILAGTMSGTTARPRQPLIGLGSTVPASFFNLQLPKQ